MRIIVADDELPARKELGHMLEQCIQDVKIDYADSGESVLNILENNTVNVVFVDIHLGDMNGTSLASVIKKLYPNVLIVFATAYENYAVKAFDMEVLDYITKPFDLERLEQTVQKILVKQHQVSVSRLFDLTASCSPEKLPISRGKNVMLINICDIVYIETNGKGVLIHTFSGDYTGNYTLNFYEQRLANQSFYRIQKSYLINLKQLEEIIPWFNNGYCAKMIGFKNENLPIGRNQIKELRQIYLF
ncbi:MAG: LytTR family DNA-binding domain-containing protein [Lachnospiraceae bacterium]|nr:LytTR family DNA-binding domain-containing protein [Lachnospiraceae bacterium]